MEVKFLDVKQLRTDLGITQLELSKKTEYATGISLTSRKWQKETIKRID